jgi:enolase
LKISNIDAYQVFDSRGNPTLEVEVVLENGIKGMAMVPSGASTGRFEALELRDNNPEKFRGKSVHSAVRNVKDEISHELSGLNVHDQKSLDERMCNLDGTTNKQNLGANAIVGVSMAIARASANHKRVPLFHSLGDGEGTLIPLPEIQIIGGGAHSGGRIDVQDFMIICTGAESYQECLEMTYNVYVECGELLKKQGKLAGVADEGGFWPEFNGNERVFDTLLEAIEKAGYQPGKDIHLSLDIAASEFFQDGKYHLSLENRSMKPEQFYFLIEKWCREYPIISIEDPFEESDTENWQRLTESFGHSVQIIGDDLYTTDIRRVEDGYHNELTNSVLIKLNQIGTVTETMECIRKAQSYGWTPVVSARSGETEDPFISHLAVATNAGQLKVGSFTRSERMVKWNELIRIERELDEKSRFIGSSIFPFH